MTLVELFPNAFTASFVMWVVEVCCVSLFLELIFGISNMSNHTSSRRLDGSGGNDLMGEGAKPRSTTRFELYQGKVNVV